MSVGPKNPAAKTIELPGLGISVPVVPTEWMSIDGDFTASWSRLTDEIAKDLSFTGSASVKFWDQNIGKASVVLYPYEYLGALKLDNIGLTDPTGGRFFAIRGEAEGWLDLRGEGAYWLRDRGAITIGGRGVTAEWIITGPSPTILAACSEQFGSRVGGAINFDDPLRSAAPEDGQCDLAPFRKRKPQLSPTGVAGPNPPPFWTGADQNTGKPSRRAARQARATPTARQTKINKPRAQAARAAGPAAEQRFTVRGDEGIVPFDVPVDGGSAIVPDLTLKGPGLTVQVKDGKVADNKRAVGFVFPGYARFILNKPRRGTYTVTVNGKGAGAPKIGALRFSSVLPEPQVETGLERSTCAPTIHWSAAGITGQKLRFLERTAAGGESIVGESTNKTGKLAVTPITGGRSELFVEVWNGGTVRKRQSIGTYSSAVGDALPGPSGVRVAKAATKKRQGKSVKQSTVSWQPVCGAESYSVVVTQGKTESKPITVSGTSVAVPRPKAGATVTVTSLGRGGVGGGSTLVPVG